MGLPQSSWLKTFAAPTASYGALTTNACKLSYLLCFFGRSSCHCVIIAVDSKMHW
jgi:hypothetical protein